MIRRFIAAIASLALVAAPAADAQVRRPGVPMSPALRLFTAAASNVTTVFFKSTTPGITVPSGITSARITAIGRGANGGDSNPNSGGGGGAASQGVVSVTPGESLTATLNTTSGAMTSLTRSGTALVAAQNGLVGANGAGGSAANGTGTIRFSGGSGFNGGGGAAGTSGNGGNSSSGTGGARGAGMTFTQTSNGETATNGTGGSSNGTAATAYGGGGAIPSQPGAAGIIIIEWGQQ